MEDITALSLSLSYGTICKVILPLIPKCVAIFTVSVANIPEELLRVVDVNTQSGSFTISIETDPMFTFSTIQLSPFLQSVVANVSQGWTSVSRLNATRLFQNCGINVASLQVHNGVMVEAKVSNITNVTIACLEGHPSVTSVYLPGMPII